MFGAWAAAFLFTQLVEAPLYVRAVQGRPAAERVAIALGASALTHPLVWWLMLGPLASLPYPWALGVAEGFAIGVEALWLRAFAVPRAVAWSLVANGASAGLGGLVRVLST